MIGLRSPEAPLCARGLCPRLTLALTLLVAAPAYAQGSDTVTAEALFQEGRDLLRDGELAAACPKLAESYRLDPATGTLIALALCHEQQGKIASAWAEYVDAASRAKSEGRADREEGSRDKATALKPRLSTLRIDVPDAVASLPSVEIRRDGVALGRATWGAAIPIDGGSYVIEATAPGRAPFRTTVSVKPELDAVKVAVPPLADAGGAAASTAVASQPEESPSPASESKPYGALEWTGIGTAVVGVVGWGVGGYFLATALGEKKDSEGDCDGNVCGPAGFAKKEDAVTHGNLATLFGIGGTVLVGVGATLYFVGRGSGDEAPKQASVAVRAYATPGGAVAAVGGTF